jgi:aldehyde dehydrogenase (NAD+)
MATETQQQAAAPTHDAEPIVHEQLYIGGEWVDPAGDGVLEVIDSTTEVPAHDRAQVCLGIGMRLASRGEEIAALVSREVGMPIELSAQIQAGLPTMDFMSIPDVVEQTEWEERVGNSLIVHEPVGVVGCITPWNYPLHQLCAKLAPALAAGCAVVAKPSEVTPLTAFLLAEIVDEVGLPPGLFNLVPGYGPVVGEAIAAHPGIDMVSFTGSTRAGKRVAEVASQTVKRVALELGGKSPNVILDDADLLQAIPDGLGKCFLNSGQTCSALTRMLVPRAKLDEAEQIAAATLPHFKVGDPLEPGHTLGPLVSDAQRERVRGYILKGVEEGAKLVAGGAEPPEGAERGYFVQPTIFSEVTPEMTIAQEEIFGPVLVLMPYEDEDDAVRIANDTVYGLAGGVWSGDTERARRVAKRLRTGQVEINGAAFNPLAPFGGYKQSGHGRELGKFGLEEFLETKAIQL